MSQTAYSASYLFLRVNKTPICNLHTNIWNIEMFILIGNDLCEVFLSVVLFVFKKINPQARALQDEAQNMVNCRDLVAAVEFIGLYLYSHRITWLSRVSSSLTMPAARFFLLVMSLPPPSNP